MLEWYIKLYLWSVSPPKQKNKQSDAAFDFQNIFTYCIFVKYKNCKVQNQKAFTSLVSSLNGCGKRPSFTREVRPDMRKKGVQHRMKMPIITPTRTRNSGKIHTSSYINTVQYMYSHVHFYEYSFRI